MNTIADDLSFDLFALREAYLTQSVSVKDVVALVLSRAEQFKSHNVWISLLNTDTLLARADYLAGQDPQNLPLYGIPFAVKDNIDVAGLPTTAACPGFSYLPTDNAFVVQLLLDAGALLIGKTNMDQFATGLTGTRSPEPYGICKNALNTEYISGGSSSGSAVAVALNMVSFALGTDTAGSGRIPAAFNNIVGLKPSRGLLSCAGLVPACKSLDCVSVFTKTAAEAEILLGHLLSFDLNDAYARNDRLLLEPPNTGVGLRLRFGVPKFEQLQFFGDLESADLFKQTISQLETLGEVVEIDFRAFLDAAVLLYGGPWLAERYAGIRQFVDAQPEQVQPVIKQVLAGAKDKTAVAAFEALHTLQALKQQTLPLLRGLSCIVVPTAPRIYKIAEVLADPVQLNSNLGYYTNYMNLLDLCGVAIPSGFYANGLPFGITLFSEALSDWRLLSLAKLIEASLRNTVASNKTDYNGTKAETITKQYRRIAVCGAHMQGLPLNPQLLSLGAKFHAQSQTSANYRLYALTHLSPERPGLIRDEVNGQAIALELWDLPKENWADFIANLKSPLCIGSVELASGGWEYGFLCEDYPIGQALDITAFGGWRNYIKGKS